MTVRHSTGTLQGSTVLYSTGKVGTPAKEHTGTVIQVAPPGARRESRTRGESGRDDDITPGTGLSRRVQDQTLSHHYRILENPDTVLVHSIRILSVDSRDSAENKDHNST